MKLFYNDVSAAEVTDCQLRPDDYINNETGKNERERENRGDVLFEVIFR
jgi:hypothetical protein